MYPRCIVFNNNITISTYGILVIGGGKAHYIHTGSTDSPQTIEAVLEADTLRRLHVKGSSTDEVALGVGLAPGEVLGRENAVKELVNLGVSSVQITHLVEVAAGNDSSLHLTTTQFGNEVNNTRHIVEIHVLFEVIELGGNAGLLVFMASKILSVNLIEGLSFNLRGKIIYLREITAAHLGPETSVQTLGVYDHPVKVKKCCFNHYLLNNCISLQSYDNFIVTLHTI